ncbi:TPA: hypothetical protein ACPZJC_004179, partial [Yersinia enterocolitica]
MKEQKGIKAGIINPLLLPGNSQVNVSGIVKCGDIQSPDFTTKSAHSSCGLERPYSERMGTMTALDAPSKSPKST